MNGWSAKDVVPCDTMRGFVCDFYRPPHRHITGEIRGEVKPLPPPNLIDQQTQMDGVKLLKRQAEAGYFYLDEKRSTYRPTAKGAIIITFRVLMGPIRKSQTRRNARRLLATVGA